MITILKSRLGRVKRILNDNATITVDIQSLFEVALKQAQKDEQEQHSKNKLYIQFMHKSSVSVKAKLISLMNLELKPVLR